MENDSVDVGDSALLLVHEDHTTSFTEAFGPENHVAPLYQVQLTLITQVTERFDRAILRNVCWCYQPIKVWLRRVGINTLPYATQLEILPAPNVKAQLFVISPAVSVTLDQMLLLLERFGVNCSIEAPS